MLRLGHIKRGAYDARSSLGLGDAVSHTESDVGHGNHLAVYFHCIIKAKHVEDYGQKGSDAREGVNL